MERIERFYKIDQLLAERRAVPLSVFMEKLSVSRATLKRDLEYLRTRLNAPIVWDRDAGGYRFETQETVADRYELPGLWFSPAEIHALLTMQQLLNKVGSGGLLGPQVAALQQRLRSLLASADNSADDVVKRVLVLGVASRTTPLEPFSQIGAAVLRRKRLLIHFSTPGSDGLSEWEVSPQRLVCYRGNWFLDVWCHGRDRLHSLPLVGIRRVESLTTPARNISASRLDAQLGAAYGIFPAGKSNWAILRFSAEQASRVVGEEWHPKQQGQFESDGSYRLQLPYRDEQELVADILRYGRGVEVLSPPELRQRVTQELIAACRTYL